MRAIKRFAGAIRRVAAGALGCCCTGCPGGDITVVVSGITAACPCYPLSGQSIQFSNLVIDGSYTLPNVGGNIYRDFGTPQGTIDYLTYDNESCEPPSADFGTGDVYIEVTCVDGTFTVDISYSGALGLSWRILLGTGVIDTAISNNNICLDASAVATGGTVTISAA
jgi:hypothetical protein